MSNRESDDSETIESLKRKRGAFKGQVTQFRNKLLNLKTIGEVESNIRRLQLVYDKYHQVQLKIEILDDAAATDRTSFEEDYEYVESALLNKLHDLKKLETQTKELNYGDASANSTQIEQNIPTMSIKLPELKLPTFSGLESEWLAFRDIFKDLIHNKPTIDDTVKFVYLISQIRAGKAYNLIENLPVTSDNYNVAWEALCKRYDNAILIQRIHMKELYEIKTPYENSAVSLQTFIDHSVKHFSALKSLHIEVEKWDLMLIHHLTEKLDKSSKIYIIKNSETNKLLNFDKLINLLQNRVRILDAIKVTTNTKYPTDNKRSNYSKGKSISLVSNNSRCSYCEGSHMITNCPGFLDIKISPQMRFQYARNNQLCTNCLVSKHKVGECDKPPCSKCSLKHNDLLHFGTNTSFRNTKSLSANTRLNGNDSGNIRREESNSVETTGLSSCQLTNTQVKNSARSRNVEQILIGTTLLNIATESNGKILCRALLDSGSHLNFVTESIVNLLKLKKQSTSKVVSGIGGGETVIKAKVSLTITSRTSSFSATLDFFIIPKISNHLPANPVNIDLNLIPAEIQLADPYFHVPNKIDMLLGAEIYNQLFSGQAITVLKNLPPFMSSVFGYVISGRVFSFQSIDENSSTVLCTNESLHNDLKRFWEIETISVKNNFSLEEKYCEDHYIKNFKRLPSGQYSVSLPVNDNIKCLGHSNFTSLQQFYSIERKLIRKPETYTQYRDFMKEYLSLGHMSLVRDPHSINNSYNKAYYLPHHCVMKDTSTTTKLRVVFNGSSKSASNLSLNDCLNKGPTVQQDLLSIILRFRKHTVAFTADITKMYRQILIHDDQQDLQRIWWRDNPADNIQCFKLCTVTYGTKSAPYLATRTLQQLAFDETASFPVASAVLTNDFYVDDVLTGADNVTDALTLKEQLTQLLAKGSFQLRKFSSNVPVLSVPTEPTSKISLVLGLYWDTSQDEFEMNFSKFSLDTVCTKRNILSEICQLFDPLGLCAPMMLVAKLIMQTIWTLHTLDWDAIITSQVRDQWIEFKKQLIELSQIKVPRCILAPQYQSVQIYGFSDASERGFGCVVYMKSTDNHNTQHVQLICSKSRVAPLKKQTIPRLELCAALLLSQTVNKLVDSLNMKFDQIYLWSDSEITLLRIKSEPAKFASFVAHRITQIQESSATTSWCYVPTSQNPADLVSRGVMPNEFLKQDLWWSGPLFLRQDQSSWPKNPNLKISSELLNLDVRKHTSLPVCTDTETWNLFHRYSSFTKLLRVTALILRFIKILKSRRQLRITGALTLNELNGALTTLIKIVQRTDYSIEIHQIQKKLILRHSNLKNLHPFIDDLGILRVGGRLRHSSLDYNNKHQIILPGKHIFTTLLARSEHFRLLHCGPQTLLYNLRSQYWIINGRNLCKHIVHKCIICFRNKPKLSHQLMGELPADRVNQSRPFSVVGIDFCGPFFAKPNSRSRSKGKIYICVFVCFAVKAVHLELVMDLSTQSFLACLRRFISRRGFCSKIYSDNATNFIGSRTELKELRDLFLAQAFQNEAKLFCANHKIEWLTIPPRSPHFGGLWESAIKNAKWHLKRIIGLRTMTQEEYLTLTCQIEACINSRPLTAVSNDPTDFTALSPGHFLIGCPLVSLPEPSILDLNINRLSRYQMIQAMFQEFWKRWHTEYLNELQTRYKWQSASIDNYKIGSLVLLHEDNTPPLNWTMGRITQTHPGSDNRIRVVTVKTSKSVFKRSINKISVLPIESETQTKI